MCVYGFQETVWVVLLSGGGWAEQVGVEYDA